MIDEAKLLSSTIFAMGTSVAPTRFSVVSRGSEADPG